MRDGAAGPNTPPDLIAFPHWSAVANRAAELITAGLDDEDGRFIWPRVAPHLLACGVLIGPSAIEIRPYHPPAQTLPGYRFAKQRLYLSATLGTMDDLQRRLGVASVTNVLEKAVAEDLVGHRMFLLNPGDDGPLTDAPIAFALAQASRAGRTAWLCASHNEADAVEALLRGRELSTYRLRGGGDDGAMERWASDVRGHLVTAGRFDGLDLAGDLCRLVVLPSVPAASTEFERFVMAYLADATFMRHRAGQRVTQALGRANRRAEDWAMYLGLAPGFGTLLAQSAVRRAIPTDVLPAIDTALSRLEEGWVGAYQAAREFWDGSGTTLSGPTAADTSASDPRLRPGRSRPTATAGSADDEVSAVTRMWLEGPVLAAEAASRAATALTTAGEVEHGAFWRYVEAQAHYENGGPSGISRSIDALRSAGQGGAMTAWFVRLGRILDELRGEQVAFVDEQPWRTWDEWIGEAGAAGVQRAANRCRTGLSGTHNEQSEAVEILGRLAGVSASRPAGRSVTDVIWSWPGARTLERRMWEVKTGDPDAIPRDWIDQTLGQIAEARPSSRLRVVGCLLTHVDEIDIEAAGAAADQICLVHQDAAAALAELLSDRLIQYAIKCGGGSAAERGAAREFVEERMPKGAWLKELLAPSGGQSVRRADVIVRFPSR